MSETEKGPSFTCLEAGWVPSLGALNALLAALVVGASGLIISICCDSLVHPILAISLTGLITMAVAAVALVAAMEACKSLTLVF